MGLSQTRQIFLGQDQKLRPIWRAGLYFASATWIVAPALDKALTPVPNLLRLKPGLTAGLLGFTESKNLLAALACTFPFLLYEGRRVTDYGFAEPWRSRWQGIGGAAAGILMTTFVAVGMLVLGGMQIHGLAGTGSEVAWSGLWWLLANICVGVAEEFWWRSYLQVTLSKAVGFWPSATIIAMLFTADHYFYKQGENIWDVITLVSLSLLLSYSFRRTGSLWFAVGFHSAFDYMQLFVIGTPNGARVPIGRLLNAQFPGPAWMTGGVLGTEASLLIYPEIALLWIYVSIRYRCCGWPEAHLVGSPPLAGDQQIAPGSSSSREDIREKNA